MNFKLWFTLFLHLDFGLQWKLVAEKKECNGSEFENVRVFVVDDCGDVVLWIVRGDLLYLNIPS